VSAGAGPASPRASAIVRGVAGSPRAIDRPGAGPDPCPIRGRKEGRDVRLSTSG
jgi:hypothetical protein